MTMDEIEELALDRTCGYCGKGPGEWCVTKSGALYNYLHARRTRELYALWRSARASGHADGYHGGQRAALRAAAEHLERTPNQENTYRNVADWLRARMPR